MTLGDRIVVMSKGAIAQVGQPRDIYFTPSSRFVAEFIGAANIVEGQSAGGRLTLPGGWLTLAEGAPAGPVLAMLRPETIRVIAAAGAGLIGRVDSVSFVGDRQRLTINDAANGAIFVDVPNTLAVKAGDQVGLTADPNAIRVLPDGN